MGGRKEQGRNAQENTQKQTLHFQKLMDGVVIMWSMIHDLLAGKRVEMLVHISSTCSGRAMLRKETMSG